MRTLAAPRQGQVEASLMRDLAAIDSHPLEQDVLVSPHPPSPLRDTSGSQQAKQRIQTPTALSALQGSLRGQGPLTVSLQLITI